VAKKGGGPAGSANYIEKLLVSFLQQPLDDIGARGPALRSVLVFQMVQAVSDKDQWQFYTGERD
jgi:hypothetical protein